MLNNKLEFRVVIFKISYGIWLLMKRDKTYDWTKNNKEGRVEN